MLTVLLVSHGDFHITSCVARHHFCGTSAGLAPFIYLFFCSLVRWREVYDHAGFFNHRFQRYTDTQRKMLQPSTNLSLWKELCKKQPLDKVLASGFDFFSTLSASMMQYYLSGDTYHLGENCSVFLCLIGGYKWLHLCDDCGAASEATTAEGIWAP